MTKKFLSICLLFLFYTASMQANFIPSFLCSSLAAVNAALTAFCFKAYRENVKAVDVNSTVSRSFYLLGREIDKNLHNMHHSSNTSPTRRLTPQDELRIVVAERYILLSAGIVFAIMTGFFGCWAIKYLLKTNNPAPAKKPAGVDSVAVINSSIAHV